VRLPRRSFLELVGATAGATYLPTWLAACASAPSPHGDPTPGTDGGLPPNTGSTPPAEAGSGLPDAADAAVEEAPVLAETGPTLLRRVPKSFVTASREELDVSLRVISGKLPRGLYGHAFVVAGLPWGDGSPVPNGDGMLYRLDFGGAEVNLRSRIAKTPCYYADLASFGTSSGFQNKGIVRIGSGLGVRNELNTAWLPIMDDRLLVTFDGGRPYEVDTESLEAVTPIGKNEEWTSGLPDFINGIAGGPFRAYFSTAHPYYDPSTREVFTLNYTADIPFATPKFNLFRWDGASALERFEVVTEDGKALQIKMSAHQMAVTADWVILMDTAFLIENEQLFNPDTTRAESPDTSLYLVARRDLTKGGAKVTARKLVIPREIAHFVADYDNPGGKITLSCTHGCGWLASEWLRKDDVRADNGQGIRADLVGMLVTSSDQTPVAQYVIDPTVPKVESFGMIFRDPYTWSVALYTHRGSAAPGRFEDLFWTSVGFQPELLTKRVYDLSKDYKYRKTSLDQLPFAKGTPATLFRTNMRSMDEKDFDGYTFPDGRAVSSPLFLPREGSKGGTRDGFVLCVVLSDDTSTPGSSGDELWIFDAAKLAQGPLCRLAHPKLDLGYTLHTTFLERIGPRKASYRIPVREDFSALVAKASAATKTLFEDHVYPHFPD
jgi:carotenoid cleavage dioxygenase-like enzyme